MKHIDIADVLHKSELIGTEAVVCGWVRTYRDSSAVAFLELADGTSFARLQVVVAKNAVSLVAE